MSKTSFEAIADIEPHDDGIHCGPCAWFMDRDPVGAFRCAFFGGNQYDDCGMPIRVRRCVIEELTWLKNGGKVTP